MKNTLVASLRASLNAAGFIESENECEGYELWGEDSPVVVSYVMDLSLAKDGPTNERQLERVYRAIRHHYVVERDHMALRVLSQNLVGQIHEALIAAGERPVSYQESRIVGFELYDLMDANKYPHLGIIPHVSILPQYPIDTVAGVVTQERVRSDRDRYKRVLVRAGFDCRIEDRKLKVFGVCDASR